MKLFNKTTTSPKAGKNPEKPSLTIEDVEKCIEENRYAEGDNVEQIIKKYKRMYKMKNLSLDAQQTTYLHDAMLTFVNMIPVFTEKKDILYFLIHTVQYTRTRGIDDFINVATNVGFTVAKTASLVGRVATLGMAGEVLDRAEKLTKKALTTNDNELATTWEAKLNNQIDLAKSEYGGVWSGDKDFCNRLNELKKQMDRK